MENWKIKLLIFSVFLQCRNIVAMLKIMLFLIVHTMLWQHWKLTLFLSVATTLWQHCQNGIVWLDFGVGHQSSHSVAWMLSFGWNSTLGINIHRMFTQHCLNVVWMLWSNVISNLVPMLWQCCKIMSFSNVLATLLHLWQCCYNMVQLLSSTLYECCRNVEYDLTKLSDASYLTVIVHISGNLKCREMVRDTAQSADFQQSDG